MNEKKKKRSTTSVLLLVLLAILALFIGFAIVDGSETADEQPNEQPTPSNPETNEGTDEQPEVPETEEKEEPPTFNPRALIGKYAVYEADLKQYVPFRIGLATKDAYAVPVSILVPKANVRDTLGTSTPTHVELYNAFASDVKEEAYGFVPYHPYDGQIEEDGTMLRFLLKDPVAYDQSSASSSVFFATVEETFFGYQELWIFNEDEEPVDLPHIGSTSEPFPLPGERLNQPYFMYVVDEQIYLAPFIGGPSYSDPKEAFEALKGKELETDSIYKSPIPKGIDYDVALTENLVTITFKEPVDLTKLSKEEAFQLVESLNLTASSFGRQVKLDGVVQTTWQKFDFNRPLPKAVGANPLPY
ncbi:MAG TPA: hypothetical protein VIG60_07255 [Savagea sp.]